MSPHKQRRIHFGKARITRKKLITFYQTYPYFIPLLESDPDNGLMWEMIFAYFFGEMSKDPQPRTVPAYYRQGSTDPRWDTLFFTMHGLSLHRKIVLQHKRIRLFKQDKLEAA